MIKRIAFTMYPVTDMAAARKFYEQGLGLKASAEFGDGKWVEYDPGGCFAITTMPIGVKPSSDSGGSIAFEVDDVVALTKKLEGEGVKVKMPVMDTPVCQMSVVIDPCGNAVTLHQLKRKT
ncbi:MAG TPA: VOC family protein [Polyangiaceae bacterium]